MSLTLTSLKMEFGAAGDGVDLWDDGVAVVVRLNRPHAHNALDQNLLDALSAALQRIEANAALRAVILTGAGQSFCSGDDLKMVHSADDGAFRRSLTSLQRLTAQLLALRTPVICAFNGPAFGAGLELALACDLRLATPTFSCATPEVRLGLLATNGATVLLPALVGAGRARRMLLGGARFDAAWCLAAGLVDELLPPDGLMARALEIAYEFAQGGPEALRATRRLLNAPLSAALEAAMGSELQACAEARCSDEGQQGLAAYFAQTKPAWRP